MAQSGDEEWSWVLPEIPNESPRRRMTDSEPDFRRTVWLTIAGTLLPGLGLIAANRRRVGAVIAGSFLSIVLAIGIWVVVDPQSLVSLGVRPGVLKFLSVALLVAAGIWVSVVVASHLSLRRTPTRRQRIIGGILVGGLAFAVAAPMAVAARLSYVQATAVDTVFKSEKKIKSATRPTLTGAPNPTAGATDAPPAQDPWQGKPRLNVLLLGGDDGPGREGTRTDTIIVASIDTTTGNTTLFSLPRNTARMPFPTDSALRQYYPYGFTDGNGGNPEFFLNAMYGNVPANVPADVLGPTDNLGADALKISVGDALGLSIDYFALINLKGFEKLVNALGGITVNINNYIAIGGNTDLGIPPSDYLEPGPDQHLNGKNALWYARGRYGSDDFARMDRQRCVINAIIKQANPANVVARYEDIAKAGQEIVQTDMPQEVLPLMVGLGLRVKGGNVRSVVFKHGVDGFLSPDPNFARMRERVTEALGETSTAQPSPSPSASKNASPTTKPSDPDAPQPSSTPSTASEDVSDTCAWQPEVAAEAKRPG